MRVLGLMLLMLRADAQAKEEEGTMMQVQGHYGEEEFGRHMNDEPKRSNGRKRYRGVAYKKGPQKRSRKRSYAKEAPKTVQ